MVHDQQKRFVDGASQDKADAAAQAAMYRLMVENTVDLIIRYDINRVRTYVSPSARDIMGYEPSVLLGRKAFEFNHPDDRDMAIATFHRIGPAHRSEKLVFRARREDGRYIWLEVLYRYLPEDGGIISVSRDITDRKHAEEKLAEANARLESANHLLGVLAQQDGLTGLANRRCFDQVLDTEFHRAQREHLPLGIVMVDVDFFKSYNDRYGHLAGDECLRQICGAVSRALRRPGDLAARYGGEEIAVLLPSTSDSGATSVAERIRGAVAALAIKHSASPNGIATISAGAGSIIPFSDDDDPAVLVNAADQALYQAKRDGRNRVRRRAQTRKMVET
jgi:diguanylate cyclase (GGDEF)-like protein/PAS domain S-box-containing protein